MAIVQLQQLKVIQSLLLLYKFQLLLKLLVFS